jgi:mannose-6-phosphate isomerase-like protein (cupin superfamily)
MPTAVETSYAIAKIDELEPAPRIAPPETPDDGRKRFDVRRTLDITAFGVQAFSAPSGGVVVNEHDEVLLTEAGQQELYIVMSGAATFEIDGETVDAPAGSLVHVQPAAKRKATATEDGTTILVVGATPGKAYEPAPEEMGQAFAAYNAGDYELALEKQLVVVEKQPENPVAHFNVGCFAARAGHADQAIEALERAIAINDGVKELIATDEDLDSLRQDERFQKLAK